jgi:hypothetical protein
MSNKYYLASAGKTNCVLLQSYSDPDHAFKSYLLDPMMMDVLTELARGPVTAEFRNYKRAKRQ